MKLDKIISDIKNENLPLRKILLVITLGTIIVYSIFNFDSVITLLTSTITVLSPFITGFAIAFILNIFVNLFERKIFKFLIKEPSDVWKKLQRPLTILLSFLIVLVILTTLVLLIIPEVVASVRTLSENAPIFIEETITNAWSFLESLNLDLQLLEQLNLDWGGIVSTVTSQVTTLSEIFLNSLLDTAFSFTSSLVNVFIAIIIAIYMLSAKEKLTSQAKSILNAFFNPKNADNISKIASLSNSIFSKFVSGQLTEGAILGLLCYIGMSIFGFDYAPLISFVIGLTSLVPMVGAYIGGALGAFLLLLANPMDALWFVIFLVVLQQLEGNLIYPRVVGGSVGLPAIWVMFAIIVGGNLFGIIGALLGVPICSIAYTLIREETKKRLKKRDVIKEHEEKISSFRT